MAVAKKTSGKRKTAAGAGSRRGSGTSKKVTTGHGTSRAKSAGKKTPRSGNKNTAVQRRKRVEAVQEFEDHQAFEAGITLFVIGILAVLCYLSYFGLAGKAGRVVGGILFGAFGWFAWFLPVFIMIGYVFYLVNQGDKRVARRMLGFCGIVLSLMGLSDLIFQKQIITEYYISNHVFHKEYFDCMYLTCSDVMSHGKFNGGLLGRAVGGIFSTVIGRAGAIIVLFVLLLLFLYIFYGVEMMGSIRRRNARLQEMSEIRQQVTEEEDYREPSYRVFHSTVREMAATKTGRGWKPAPELEKVPKVQSFDLQELNERLDNLERSSVSKPVSGNSERQGQSEKTEREKKLQSRREALKGVDSTVVEIKGGDSGKSDKTAVSEEETNVECSERQAEPEIPIYRNELQEKFGTKKPERKLEKPVKVVREPEGFERDSAFDAFESRREWAEPAVASSDRTDDRQEPEDVHMESGEYREPEVNHLESEVSEEEEKKSIAEVINDYVEEEADAAAESIPAKPMASFSHKEEVTDVTSSGEKPARSTANAGDTVIPFPGRKDAQNVPEPVVQQKPDKPYVFPPIDLLAKPKAGKGGMSDSKLRATATKLKETLKSFNVNVQIGAVTCGPTVTRYEVLPEQGVRVNKITNLSDDLKLSLAAPSIRIEAPIPGKAAVGIEVPNEEASAVSFRELLEGDTFSNAKSPLTFAVGKDIAGKLIMSDIGKMPHVLIAGATGSGKSVCINTLIMSILYKADPKDVKLIMIDPKVVELSVYNGIPHLFCPVVTDPKEAAAALNWAVREMMDRYNKFKELGVRNISGYNEKIKTVEDAASAGYEKMPYLVVIVDEFADLMMVASKEVEDAVCRLAQLARAAGIHLVLATQRPSVNVITGVIKANIPSRVAFSVSSAIDSRTILDKGGAEKLLGKGDMLFFPSGYTEPVRVQGAFVSDKEVSDVVDFLRDSNETPEYNNAVTEIVEEPQEETAAAEKKSSPDRDEYFEEAGRFVIELDRAAAGQLQRHFSIGFNRAGRIIDQLHRAGVVGPAEGTKPRKILMTAEEFEAMLSGVQTDGAQQEGAAQEPEMTVPDIDSDMTDDF